MAKEKYISPIAIDLGAKNTGVYFAHYREGSALGDIEREGKVYSLGKDNYTLLMANRTAARHQRRGYDRRQMVKRLFKLIWEKCFNLPWDKDVQQTISFLLNRRGFSFLTEEYDAEQLSRFPKEAYDKLPAGLKKEVKKNNEGEYDFAGKINEWTQRQDAEKFIKKKCEVIETSIYLAKLRAACDKHTRQGKSEDSKRDSNKLRDLDQNIFKRLKSIGVKGLEQAETESYRYVTKKGEEKTYRYSYGDRVNLEAYINYAGKTKSIFESICALDSSAGDTDPDLWSFNISSFNLETAVFGQPDETEENSKKRKSDNKKRIKTHLHHLAFALHKTLGELQSGGRHRSKYFDEINSVLNNESHTHNYLKRFCERLNRDGYQLPDAQPLNAEKFCNLIGHLSNLELKPLRKYFNDEEHKNGDYWNEGRLTQKFENWILREWRVNPQKDKLKVRGGKYDYEKLKDKWKNKSGNVVDFWLDTDPNWTIPPYQDNNNRRPPKCQSLVLNPSYLDDRYSDWREWLNGLKEIKDVETFLDGFGGALEEYFTDDDVDKLIKDRQRKYERNHGKAMSNRQTKALTKQIKLGTRTRKDHLNARVLQFILDRVKDDDPFKLNEIYSHAKKYRQQQSTPKEKDEAKDKLEKAICDSELPKALKTPRYYENEAIFEDGAFLHFVCKYYKQRQKARDGRIFIHPEYRYVKGRGYENTGRFDDKDHLLTYCNHKPRQKRYQLLNDLAGLLQVSPGELEERVKEQDGKEIDEKIDKWLNGIEYLKTNCEKAAKEQKDRRGSLKLDIQSVCHKTESELSSSDLKKLHRFCEKAKGLCLDITKDLYDDLRQQQWEEDLKRNPASAVYFLAQINNLVFKERSGNATTCAVCSADNAQRMQRRATEDEDGAATKAARLPAIPTRLIDGVVMRMTRIVGGAIAKDKWEKIEAELKRGNEVCVPIITESNQFEFEPNLKELKGKKSSEKGSAEQLFSDKRDRIKQASLQVSAYSGEYLKEGKFDESTEELDHIIPRSSNEGVLNDEANLICVTKYDNQKKGEKEYDLENLAESYKKTVFGFSDKEEIKEWIIETIGDGSGNKFKFGQYRSFNNLGHDEQKAFRHALFLNKGHPLREKVINAIDNRTRTLVNGTQRYFAEVLANNLYKKAKRVRKESQISFDFFGVEVQSSSRGGGIRDLRDEYEKIDDKLSKFAKEKGKQQEPYSHLIDAQLAFAIAADTHRNNGSLKLEIDDSTTLWPFSRDTGERSENNIFNAIKLSDTRGSLGNLKRREVYDVETHHRELLKKGKRRQLQVGYQIHRDSIIGEKFFPLIKCRNGEIKKGFHLGNSESYKPQDFEILQQRFLQKSNNTTNLNYEVWVVDKRKAQSFLMEIGARGANQDEEKLAKLLDGLSYQTRKKSIQAALSKPGSKPPETVGDALRVWDDCICKKKEKLFKKDGLLLPVFDQWSRLKTKLEQADKNQPLQEFLETCDLFKGVQKYSHQKKRKVFSLPVIATIGNIRLKRKTWDRNTIIQTVPEESLARYGCGYKSEDRPHTILSKNSIPKEHYTSIPGTWNIEPRKWVSIPKEYLKDIAKDLKDTVIIWAKIKHQDAGRCTACITVSSIKGLSLPQDKPYWKGKVIYYKDKQSLDKAQDKDKNNSNYHCLFSGYKWFSKPFALPKDRRQVIIRRSPQEGIIVEFTISKTKEFGDYLSTCTKNQS